MSEIAVRAEGLGKQYRLGMRRVRYSSLRASIMQALTTPFRRRVANPPGAFWALRDVSFEIKRGEVVGIIGRNGAGKSTLLKILSRITEPTTGQAEIHGRVGALLEVGTGFHPELTGRENIYLNGAILGMTRREIQSKFDEIVAFAEIEKFMDTPAKHYSSGMYMRLAFAVAAHLEPETLLVDEVLAVGDAEFQRKCLGKMQDVAHSGRTVLFVSHNMAAINRLCERTLWIDSGQLRLQGPTESVVSRYLTSWAVQAGEQRWVEGLANPGEQTFKFLAVRVRTGAGEITPKLDVRKPFWIELDYALTKRLPFVRVGFVLSTVQGVPVFEMYDSDDARFAGAREPGQYRLRCEVPGDLLNTDRYLLSLNAGLPNVRNLAYAEGVLSFDIEDAGAVGSHIVERREGVIRPRLYWQRETLT